MSHVLNDAALDQLFRQARTANGFLDTPISESTLRELYELVKWGPTGVNGAPARFVFLKSEEARNRLLPALMETNRAKTSSAPVTVIVGYDEDFHERLPYLFPHADAKRWYDDSHERRRETAFLNGTLQGAYLILAARALGLDVGVMTGFDHALVDEMFFAETAIKSSMLVNLGTADASKIFPRLPRLSFDEAARIL
ncbi:MAG: malonic semialdehyde reductase [Xanthomonadaceae bacterium]|jgi:3-hydroxypropanoate dehydrogenase|nr:malonic semialdehyde reductase [Xanthomonadaceae bacterium]